MSIISGKNLKPHTKAFVIVAITIAAFLLPAFLYLPAAATPTSVDSLGLLQLGTATGGAHIQSCTGDSCGTGLAWGQIFGSTGTVVTLGPNGVAGTFIAENPNVPDFSTFFSTSNKNSFAISTSDPCFIAGTCSGPLVWGTGSVPAKDVLTNVYSYGATNPTNGHLILYTGFERIAPNGDSHIDVEFYQNQVHLDQISGQCPKASTPCSFVGVHTIGDVVVSMDFLVGGGLGSFSARTWNGNSYDLLVNATGEGCAASGSICAYNNGGSIPTGNWTTYGKLGAVVTSLLPNAFTNFGIDVTALLGNTPCFTTSIGKTRSSGSFTAELKDFAGPGGFGICSAHIKIAPSAVNEVGVRHTFTVTFTKSIGKTTSNVPNGTKVSVTLTNSNGASFTNVINNCASPGTFNGVCTVSFTSFTAGTVTGNATGSVTLGGSTFTVTTNGQSGNSAPAVKTFVDAFITITPSAVNQVNALHTFTVTVKQNLGNGAGFVAAPTGTKPVVTLAPTNGASVQLVTNNCATTGIVNGVCTVTFTSPTGGIVNGTATATFSILGVTVTRTTNGVGMNSVPAIKKFVDAFITIMPNAVNQVNQFHTFTITVKEDAGDGLGFVTVPNGLHPVVTLTVANGATVQSLTDSCFTTGTVSGVCTVTFTSPTGGTVTGSASISLTIAGVSVTRTTNGSGNNSGTVVKTFVDASITIGPSAVNSVFVTHTFTVTVLQNSGNGAGFVSPIDGTIVTVNLVASNGANLMNVVDNCATTGTVSGKCTVSFTSSTAGNVTGTATVTLTLDTLSVTRTTDGTAKNSGPAMKQFVAGSLAWTKVDNAGKLLGGATFQVCRVANFITTTGTSGTLVSISPSCQSVDSNTSGQFLLTGLQLGNYTVQESLAPPGFALDSRVASAVLTINSPNANITQTSFGAFVDQRSILKLTQFGYVNTPTGTPTAGVVSGTTTYTIQFTNYGGASATLSANLTITVANGAPGTFNCTPACFNTFTATLAPGKTATFTVTINYNNLASGAVVSANLVANYTTNGLTRIPSGTPATISFTIQSS